VPAVVGVAKRADEVAELVVPPDESGALEHSDEGFLDEILCVVPRSADRACGAIQRIDVIGESHRFQSTGGRRAAGYRERRVED
jgi:hypothetical protein